MPVAEVAGQMLDTYPREVSLDRGLLVSCIEACSDCAESCTQCADDCLAEENVQELTTCIRRCLDCADVCVSTGRVVSRQTAYDAEVTGALLRACVDGSALSLRRSSFHARPPSISRTVRSAPQDPQACGLGDTLDPEERPIH